MPTNVPRRILPALFALTAVGAATHAANAQGAIIIRTDSSGIVGNMRAMIQRVMPISDDTVRSLIERYEPGVLTNDADANVVTIVLDNAGNYVRSSARNAKVIQPEQGQVIALNGDSVRVLTIPRTGDGTGVSVISPEAIRISTIKRVDSLGEPHVVMGAGFSSDEIETISSKRYAAGTFAKSQLIVTVVRLK